MASKFHYVVLTLYISQIVLGGYLLYSHGYTTYREVTETLIPRQPSPLGILTVSSLNCTVHLGMGIWLFDEGLQKNMIEQFHLIFDVMLTEESSLDEEMFGFQIPYTVELVEEKLEAKGMTEFDREGITIELDYDVQIVENITLVYFTFLPIPGMTDLKIDVYFQWRGGIFQQTSSTYRLYIPIATTQFHVFTEFFSILTYPVNLPPFTGELGVSIYLPADCRVVESIPPISSTSYGSGVPNGGYFPPFRETIQLSLTIEGYPEPLDGHVMSDLIRLDFESRKALDEHNRSLFGSGLWIGVGISNIIAGVYGALLSEMQRRLQK